MIKCRSVMDGFVYEFEDNDSTPVKGGMHPDREDFLRILQKRAPDGKPVFRPIEPYSDPDVKIWGEDDDERLVKFLAKRRHNAVKAAEQSVPKTKPKAKPDAK